MLSKSDRSMALMNRASNVQLSSPDQDVIWICSAERVMNQDIKHEWFDFFSGTLLHS